MFPSLLSPLFVVRASSSLLCYYWAIVLPSFPVPATALDATTPGVRVDVHAWVNGQLCVTAQYVPSSQRDAINELQAAIVMENISITQEDLFSRLLPQMQHFFHHMLLILTISNIFSALQMHLLRPSRRLSYTDVAYMLPYLLQPRAAQSVNCELP